MRKFTAGQWKQNENMPLTIRVNGTGVFIAESTCMPLSHEEQLANARLSVTTTSR